MRKLPARVCWRCGRCGNGGRAASWLWSGYSCVCVLCLCVLCVMVSVSLISTELTLYIPPLRHHSNTRRGARQEVKLRRTPSNLLSSTTTKHHHRCSATTNVLIRRGRRCREDGSTPRLPPAGGRQRWYAREGGSMGKGPAEIDPQAHNIH